MSERPLDQNESVEKEELNEAQPPLDEAQAGEDPATASLSEEDKLRAQLAEVNDKFIRLYSEFDNFRRRTSRERADLIRTAGADTILALLPVLDDFERAMKFAQDADAKGGVELIFHKLKNILESKGLKRMESVGKEFDADLHEAITNIPAPSEDMKGKVVDEAECGYYMHDKVIRFAKVIVGS